MIDVRPFANLGRFRNDWLDANYHFSFSRYYDPSRVGWGKILVWNDDEIAPKTGFDPHPHRDMEIITYVREGAITHQDSMGNFGRTEAGDVQVMSAGSGVVHAEYNREDRPTRLFQIWIEPAASGGAPSWGAAKFPKADRAGRFVTLASGRPGEGAALPIRQDAAVLAATLGPGQSATYALAPGRHAYLVLALGRATVGGHALDARDAVAIRDEAEITVTASETAEVLLVDSP